MIEKKPTLCIVAGPNGSGKTSTTIQLLRYEWGDKVCILIPIILLKKNSETGIRQMPF